MLLTGVAGVIFAMSIWLVAEAYLRMRRDGAVAPAGD
jgi:hypothetical protein